MRRLSEAILREWPWDARIRYSDGEEGVDEVSVVVGMSWNRCLSFSRTIV